MLVKRICLDKKISPGTSMASGLRLCRILIVGLFYEDFLYLVTLTADVETV